MTGNPKSRLRHPSTRLLPLLLIALAALVLPSVAHGQGTPPTVSSAAITSDPGMDNTYATGDTITVSLTFSEAVTVTGTPHVVVDIGGQPRNFRYSGDGTTAAAQTFGYTVLVGDGDTDGVSLLVNSLTLNGGTIQATDDSTDATLAHSAMTFANHKVDTEVTLLSNYGQTDASDTITVSATESATVSLKVPYTYNGFDLTAVALDIKTASDTLDVTVTAVTTGIDTEGGRTFILGEGNYEFTFSGSAATTGKQIFVLEDPAQANVVPELGRDHWSRVSFDLTISGTGAGTVEIGSTASSAEDAGSRSGFSIGNPSSAGTVPRLELLGHVGAVPYLLGGEIISTPADGTTYKAGERIEAYFYTSRYPAQSGFPSEAVLWLGNGKEHMRVARFTTVVYEGGTTRLVYSYTVQSGDADSDGILLGENPLGRNADADFVDFESGVPVDLSLPETQLGTDQAVDGSQLRACVEIRCLSLSTELFPDHLDFIPPPFEIFYTGPFTGFTTERYVYFDPSSSYGEISGATFGYAGTEYAITRLGNFRGFDANEDNRDIDYNAIAMDIAPRVPQVAIDRLALEIDGRIYRWSDGGIFNGGNQLLWVADEGVNFVEGQTVAVKLIETATATFDAASYTKTEGDSFDVTVTLGDPFGNTLTLPVVATGNGGADATDYTGIPENLVFAPGATVKTFTVTIVDDEIDDDDESLVLSFGTASNVISGGTNETATITINDNDDPQVTVSFGAGTYTVSEGGTQSITVNLSADPERTVVIPLVATGQEGADAADYTVPTGVTFDSGEMSKTVTFTAAQDDEDDDNESVRLSFGAMPDPRVNPGATDEATITIDDDDDPFVEVQFAQNSYTVPEGGTQSVTVTLSADPERTVDIPLVATAQGGADITDYSVPLGVIFNSGELSKTITFSATHDTVDDDNESVKLAIGAILPARVSQGVTNEATVSITDDDDPHVTVMFAQAGYRVVEGETVAVRVTLSADPERTVTIPLVATGQVGATTDDYSGVPDNLTINAGEMSKTFEFMATADETSDTGESVKISFGTSLPSRVTERTPDEATVTIKQVSTQFSLDCAGTATAWCADVGFSDQTAENWGRAYLRYGRGLDPPATLSDDDFPFRGVDYTVLSMELRPGTHPIMPNAWSRWQQGYSSFRIVINWGPSLRGDPAEEHYRDWVLHVDGLELPFKDAFVYRNNFTWVGAEFQQIFNDWIPSTVTKIGIEEVAAGDQDTNPLLPWAPMQVDATPEGPNGLRIDWAKPAWYTPGLNLPGLPEPTKYIVQWKLASVSWGDSADVSQREVAAGSNFHSLSVDGLTEDALYSVRVIAGNDAGDGPPSEETLGRPQDGVIALLAKTVNGLTLTLRFSDRLDSNSVPAETAFVVMADGGLIAVDSVAISGDAVILTLNRAVTAANSVLVRYDKPTDPSAVFLRDTGGDHVQIPQHLELLSAVNVTPPSSVQPLTAQFTNMPSSHDGATLFTFEIEFSEPVWVGVGLPRDDMLEVTGGTVISAPWKDRRTDKVTVHVRPDTTGDIVIALPGNRVCAGIIGSGDPPDDPVAGAPCAIGNRMLTNDSTMTIPGPSSSGNQVVENTPAEGEPRIEGIPEVGQTLSADATGIEDADGLEEVVFQYQWLADDADIAGATDATYTVMSGDMGKAISVRVSFTDDGDNEETLTSEPTVVTAAGLQLQSATVDGVTLTLTYNEELDTGVTLGTTPFAVNVNGSPRSLNGVAVGQSKVLLLLSSAVEAGDTVTVDYTAPEGDDFIRDTLGRKAASFSGQAVSNDTASAGTSRQVESQDESNRLTASVSGEPSSHDGQTAFTFELQFSEAPKLSYVTLRDHAFTVTGGSVNDVRQLEPGKNVRWEITVTPSSSADVAIVLKATTDCEADGAICTKDGGKLSGGLLLVVPGPNTPATGSPTITGTARVGETLTADTAGISDDDGLGNATFAYQWLADDAEINGATASTYTLADDDAGKVLKVRVSFTDDAGNDEELTSAATEAVAAAVARPLLTASAHDVPSSHDGSSTFTFELRFSEEFPLSYVTLRDHAFTVTGGEVTQARRLEPGKNVRWEITVTPGSSADVAIVLNATTDCSAQGAICTEDGRKLSNQLEVTVSGPGG